VPPLLTDDGATLVLVSALARWVFVREVDVARRRLRRIGWLRTPEPLDEPAVQVDGDSIHLVGESGHLLQLARRPLAVVRWRSLRPFMLPDRSVSDAFIAAPGRHLWAQLKEPFEEGGLAIIDLEEWRVGGRIHGFDAAVPVAGARPPRMVASARDEAAALYDEGGVRVEAPSLNVYQLVQLVAHPDGEGLVALAAVAGPDQDAAEPSLGLVALRPGQPPSTPLILPGTWWEQLAQLAVSLAARRVFVITELDGRNQLLAYRTGPSGIEEAWRAEVADGTVLARDAASRTVVALAPTARGLDLALLGEAPIDLAASSFGHLELGQDVPPFSFCEMGETDAARLSLRLEGDRQRQEGRLERWAEAQRKQRRGDPTALAELAGALLSGRDPRLVERLLSFALERYPGHPQLVLRRADLVALGARWDEVERLLAGVDPAALPEARACHLHHLRGLARLHAGDPPGARQCFEAGARLSSTRCCAAWNLDLAGALCDPPGAEPEGQGAALRQLVRACRLADQHLLHGDDAAARDVLDRPVVHARLELQSAARLAAAHLAHEPATPLEMLAKLVALSRVSGADRAPTWDFDQIPGLGWDAPRVAAVAARARAWLEERAGTAAPAPPRSAPPAPAPAEPAARAAGGGGPEVRPPHALPPLGHETLRQLVPGLEAAVRETVRYVRAQPGWDDTETLADDLLELQPVRLFAASYLARLEEHGTDPDEARASLTLLAQHLDYCVNFELHRRKLFLADAPPAWLLARTSLDIEGRVLRLPFPCFGLVFTDRATLEVAEALLRAEDGSLAGERLLVLTVYVKRLPAPRGVHALSLSLVCDAGHGAWPRLLQRELRFTEDDDLAAALEDRREDDARARRLALRLGEARALVHLVVNAILYANSADVPWPLAPSPIRAVRTHGQGRGEAKKARVARRAQELRKEYSDEDVFFLPGRIPISQLRALQQVERGPKGAEIMARLMVRGHWRRAARGWRDQRVRWIEPYWKGPELAPIMEKEYQLKI
jgi:hypothetical protein